ncbi:hypothetical protein CISG_05768 [Coccidioides immitis RMSCC 3703]|uniref:Uncharacterized protein n=1 Tax=Coccidioides immitis RMSCC 3703 TaxID=454286 RepID=A0A0J8QX83_COCIT|nr:hypothetical protein CISG_05768 [Coccidioides immitis RMSCC 3703]
MGTEWGQLTCVPSRLLAGSLGDLSHPRRYTCMVFMYNGQRSYLTNKSAP